MPQCIVCRSEKPESDLVPARLVRENVAALVRAEHADFSEDSFLCREDLSHYRARYVVSLLESDKGELDALEREVVASIAAQEVAAQNLNETFGEKLTSGQRVADAVASFGGSWRFIIGFGVFLALWVTVNSLVLLLRPFDPYPFILLNLILSCLAALQAPVIMMSQNRQEAKDRLRSENDYRTNLKAELEVRLLHEKVDHLLTKQWSRLLELQEVQLELLEEVRQKDQPGEGASGASERARG